MAGKNVSKDTKRKDTTGEEAEPLGVAGLLLKKVRKLQYIFWAARTRSVI
jgi:hypothetical protein